MSSDPDQPGALRSGCTRDELVAEVGRALRSLPHGAAVVLACSGGPDSTALASLTDEARPDLDLTLAYVAHGLRDPTIDDAEAALVVQHAAWLGATVVVLPVEVVRAGEGLEAAARDARYAALASEVARRGALALLLGHHADDQAETLLLRIARGTGPDGLGGMSGRSGTRGDVRLRPLLRVRRVDLIQHCQREGFPTASDPMNADPDVRRVRVRDEVLPALARIGADPVGALARLAALAHDESVALDLAATRASRDLGVRRIGAVRLVPSVALRALTPGLSRRLLRGLLAEVAGGAPRAVDVERVLRAEDGARMTLPGPLDLTVEGGWHVLAPVTDGAASGPAPVRLALRAGDGLSAAVARRAVWGPTGWAVEAEPIAAGATSAQLPLVDAERLAPGLRGDRLAVDLDDGGPFRVRARQDGDRLRTPGGTRSVADLLSEARVPRALRGRLPVVARASDDRVLWVPGIAVDEDVRRAPGRRPDATTDATSGAVGARLRLELVGGSVSGADGAIGPSH
jgi:tRNA(Ile)-lysidine synthase